MLSQLMAHTRWGFETANQIIAKITAVERNSSHLLSVTILVTSLLGNYAALYFDQSKQPYCLEKRNIPMECQVGDLLVFGYSFASRVFWKVGCATLLLGLWGDVGRIRNRNL